LCLLQAQRRIVHLQGRAHADAVCRSSAKPGVGHSVAQARSLLHIVTWTASPAGKGVGARVSPEGQV
jgi:hypothetical protein